MKVKPEQIQPPIVHVDYDDYDEEQLDEMINMFVKKSAALYTCTVISIVTSFSLHCRSNFLFAGVWQIHVGKKPWQTTKPARPHRGSPHPRGLSLLSEMWLLGEN